MALSVLDDHHQETDPAFHEAVLACFRGSRRAIPARWLYDNAGSELFEAITNLPEYYPTRTETGLLKAHCGDVAAHIGKGGSVVEFGSGSSTKTPLLLEALQPAHYLPIDISGDFLRESSANLATAFPDLHIEPIEADFMGPITLPSEYLSDKRIGFFPGSTIGNMVAASSVDLLRSMRTTLGEGSWLLIGMDRIKSPDILIPAYDDAQGVTAAFNLNLLERINREMHGTLPVDKFHHEARWNDDEARIEMHLVAGCDIEFNVDGETFTMTEGETIHTENSHKYGRRDAKLLLRAGGWSPVAEWHDEKDWFALILAYAQAQRTAP